MAALTRSVVVVVLLFAGGDAAAQCKFSNNEITNPLETGCGDRQLTFVESATNDPDDVPLGYPVPVPVASTTPVDGFRNYDQLLAGQQDMMVLHPEVDGTVVGKTIAGADIWAYRLGTPADTTVFGEPKGSVLVNGGIHAREWQSPEVLAETFERLVAGRHDGGFVQYLVDNLAVYLIPVHNVDGFKQTQAFHDRSTAHPAQPRDGRMRRKNLAVPSGAGHVDGDLTTVEDNTHGVDLNRNHPVGFGVQPGNSMPRSLIHAGGAPHSEPETQALLAAAALADADRLRLYIDVHSYTQIYFTPQTPNQARNQITQRLASAMRAVTGNKYRYSPDPVGSDIGTTASYFAANFQVPAWTLETEPLNGPQDYDGLPYGHGGFVAPDTAIARIRDELARTLLLGFYHQAGPPSVVAAEIRDADGSVVWSVDWVADGNGTRNLVTRADASLEAGGEYKLWVAFDKPMRWRIDGEIAEYPGQVTQLLPVFHVEVDNGTDHNDVTFIEGPDRRWLDQPGGAPDGYLHYRDDAISMSFTLPESLPDEATPVVLMIDALDLSGQRVDGDPATAVRWANGRWEGYEDVTLRNSLTGGQDCTLRLWLGEGPRGTHDLDCDHRRESLQPPAEPPRRGGGDFGWALLAAVSALVLARRFARARLRARRPATSGR